MGKTFCAPPKEAFQCRDENSETSFEMKASKLFPECRLRIPVAPFQISRNFSAPENSICVLVKKNRFFKDKGATVGGARWVTHRKWYRGTSSIRTRPLPWDPPTDPRHRPTVVSQGGAFSNERGTPVCTKPPTSGGQSSESVEQRTAQVYRGTSLIRKLLALGPSSRPWPKAPSRS